MSGPERAGYHFVPWVRFGVLSAVTKADPLDATLKPRLALPVKLRVNDVATPTEEVEVPLRLYGPGDVLGIDPREIVRTEPRHLTPDFPPHVFASIEFDRPDFPWLFTPASPNADRLRPWLVLVVVRKSVSTMNVDPRWPLAKLTCPMAELPDLTESWLWAHALYTGTLDDSTVAAQMAARPDQAISRLLCPRRLQPSAGGPDAGYYACLVPTFDAGRRAGLDLPPATDEATGLRLSWDVTATGSIDLPVYYQWEFNTGALGDFEDAVDRLQMLLEPPDTPPRLMDASAPGGGMRTYPGTILDIKSALRPIGAVAPPPAGSLPALQQELRTVLETPLGSGQRVNAPIYGRWQATGAGVHGPTPLAPGAAPPWLSDLNLDPRRRVAAALGAQVVQQQQEQLVAAAWEQAGEAYEANQWLRQKQLGREVTRSVFDNRLTGLAPEALLELTSPLVLPVAPAPAARAALAAAVTVPAQAAPAERLRDAVLSPAFRRLARPLGPTARQASAPPAAAPAPRSLTAFAAPPVPEAMSSLRTLLTRLVDGDVDEREIVPVPDGVAPTRVNAEDGARLARSAAAFSAATTPAPQTLLDRLDPDTTFAAEAQARITLTSDMTAGRTDALDPLLMTPTFPQPMYEPLRDLFTEMLLPGLDRIPNNSVMLLDIDAAFIEAYMAGLNDELSRELLWREFPTDLRGTYFRQFWDVRGQLAPDATEAEREALRDIPKMALWQSALGANMRPERGRGLLILLLKGDLLLRFPTALISAARARWAKTSTATDVQVVDTDRAQVLPQMRVDPVPGVTLLGFDLIGPGGAPVTSSTVAGSPAPPGDAGWFFVLEEHPTDPRFGLDITASSLTTWRELAWGDVASRGDGSGYISVRGRTPVLVAPPSTAPQEDIDRYNRERQIAWGRDAAAMAYITLQKPFRQEVHAGYWFGGR